MKTFMFKYIVALTIPFCLVMTGMPAFCNMFLAPPIHEKFSFYPNIPQEVYDSAKSIKDILGYIWQQNKKGIDPLGINLEWYPKRYGQFAIYYLIVDVRKHFFEEFTYYIDPGPRKLVKDVNAIAGMKLFKTQQLRTDIFFRVKEIFGKMCASLFLCWDFSS